MFKVALLAVLAWCAALPVLAEPRLALISVKIWNHPDPWFGGFSALEVSADGSLFTLVTDRGTLLLAQAEREADVLTNLKRKSPIFLRFANGAKMQGTARDSEALAIGTDGAAYLSFEHSHRVTRLDLKTGITTRLDRQPDFSGFGKNAGLEALAIHPDGRLFTLAETTARTKGPLALLSQDHSGAWRVSHTLPRHGPFLPVGADFDARGLLYLLERAATPLGFRSQIRRFDLTPGQSTQEVLLTSRPGQFDNLEALSVWRDSTGRTRLTLISDDNFLRVQRTEIAEFALQE